MGQGPLESQTPGALNGLIAAMLGRAAATEASEATMSVGNMLARLKKLLTIQRERKGCEMEQ